METIHSVQNPEETAKTINPVTEQSSAPHMEDDHTDSATSEEEVRVLLLQSVELLPGQNAFVQIGVEGDFPADSPLLIKTVGAGVEANILSDWLSDALLQPGPDNNLLTNPTGFTQTMPGGTKVGSASPVVVETRGRTEDDVRTWRVVAGKREEDQIRAEQRKSQLESILEEPDLPMEEKAELL